MPSYPARRSVVGASAIAAFAALFSVVACVSGETMTPASRDDASGGATTSGTAGSGAVSGNGASTMGGAVGTGGSAGNPGGGSASGGAPAGGVSNGGAVSGSAGLGSGGTFAGSGGTTSGGTTSGGTTSGGTGAGAGMAGSGGKACVNVEPPPDPNWPEATCENWATETSECSAAWFASYCDVSCGRCVPEGGGGSGGQAGVDCSGQPQVTGGNGYATRYWDCCQPHCAQSSGHRCGQDGVSNTGDQNSACSGGGSFACYDEAPRAVSDCLSYGHIAKSNPNCGACYRIQFTGEGQHNVNDPGSKLIKGKQMIVKVTNTGGDVGGSQFDLMIPGGGVGQFNACSRQWGTSDLGAQYGGFLTECTGSHAQKKECVRQECMKIPAGRARDGCLWFVDWFQVADNPKFTSQSTSCPF